MSNKKSVKFLLVPRPQRDPLAADFEAPQHVLVPKGGLDVDDVREKLPDFDPSLFTSSQETKTGMLERAHGSDGITFDSDILKAMSQDFDYEDPNNVIDDDFMDQAGGLIEDEGELVGDEMTDLTAQLFEDEPEIITFDGQEDDDDNESHDSDDYDLDQCIEQGRRLVLFKKKAQKKIPSCLKGKQSHSVDDQDDDNRTFTNYSMTSSVMRRSRGLQQIDEHFERLYEKEYADDTEIGALDLNEVKGDELLTNIEQIREMKKEVKTVRKRNHGDDYEPEVVSEHHKNAIIGDDPNADEEDLVELEVTQRENRVDCESILSYNSNLYNHPKLIVEPRKRCNSRDSSRMDADDSDIRSRSGKCDSIASSRATVLSKLSTRPSSETSEQRRARKKALKEYRKERRQERKTNQQIFKIEEANLMKQQKNNRPTLKLA